jgi:hypothetical protein
MWVDFTEHPAWKELAQGIEKQREALMAKVMDPTRTDPAEEAAHKGRYAALGEILSSVARKVREEQIEAQGGPQRPPSPVPLRKRAAPDLNYMRLSRPVRPGS